MNPILPRKNELNNFHKMVPQAKDPQRIKSAEYQIHQSKKDRQFKPQPQKHREYSPSFEFEPLSSELDYSKLQIPPSKLIPLLVLMGMISHIDVQSSKGNLPRLKEGRRSNSGPFDRLGPA